jgi:hypothetical protein
MTSDRGRQHEARCSHSVLVALYDGGLGLHRPRCHSAPLEPGTKGRHGGSPQDLKTNTLVAYKVLPGRWEAET